MKTSYTTFGEIIALWPSAADFGRDIGVSDINARAMKQRNSIPSEYWVELVAKAKERGFACISYEQLAQLAATKKVEA